MENLTQRLLSQSACIYQGPIGYKPAPSWYFFNQFQLLQLDLVKTQFYFWCQHKVKCFLSPYCLPNEEWTANSRIQPFTQWYFKYFRLIFSSLHVSYAAPKLDILLLDMFLIFLPPVFLLIPFSTCRSQYTLLQDPSEMSTP